MAYFKINLLDCDYGSNNLRLASIKVKRLAIMKNESAQKTQAQE